MLNTFVNSEKPKNSWFSLLIRTKLKLLTKSSPSKERAVQSGFDEFLTKNSANKNNRKLEVWTPTAYGYSQHQRNCHLVNPLYHSATPLTRE
nr:MAG TPA: hypothetical protein [Caudoviricetes sp.]